VRVTYYRVFVYLHVLGALGLFVSLGIEAAVLLLLGRAGDAAQAQLALRGLRVNRLLGPLAIALLLVPGVYVARVSWSSNPAWLSLSFASFLLVMILGGAITGRRITALHASPVIAPVPLALRISF
jgi:hypothetical protein